MWAIPSMILGRLGVEAVTRWMPGVRDVDMVRSLWSKERPVQTMPGFRCWDMETGISNRECDSSFLNALACVDKTWRFSQGVSVVVDW